MKKAILILGIVILTILILFALRFIIGGSEDDWICVDNEWVKHGMPSAPMPTTGCGEEKINNFDDCTNDDDCVVFGKDGDCNCGCFNKDYQWQPEGECFCAAPTFCKCVSGKCDGIFK